MTDCSPLWKHSGTNYIESVWCWTGVCVQIAAIDACFRLTVSVKGLWKPHAWGFWNFCLLCRGVWNKQLGLSYCSSNSCISWSDCIWCVSLYFLKWYNLLGNIVLLRVLKPGCGAICGPSWYEFRGSLQNWGCAPFREVPFFPFKESGRGYLGHLPCSIVASTGHSPSLHDQKCALRGVLSKCLETGAAPMWWTPLFLKAENVLICWSKQWHYMT